MTCSNCPTDFEPLHPNHRYCSRRCSVLAKGGEWIESASPEIDLAAEETPDLFDWAEEPKF
jgi:hypothetical protein